MNIMESSCSSFEEFTNRIENNLKKQGTELTEEQRVFIGKIWEQISDRAKRSSKTVKTITPYLLSSGVTAGKVAQNIEALVSKRKSLKTTVESFFKKQVAPYNERQIIELCLKKWKTKGHKEEAIERILQAYDTKSKILNLKGLYLTSLPAEIGRLSNLEHLDVSKNKLTSLPPGEIGRLSNLGKLDVSHNKLTSLPAEIGSLSNLEYLDVSHNKLMSLPAWIGGLSNLEYLDVSHNKLTSLPAWIGGLSNLEHLYVNFNKLTSLPAEIGRLSNLEGLYVSRNQLTSLPAWIRGLSNLEYLDVSHNQLTSLPAEIGGLSNLGYLDVSDNKLTSLPPGEIGRLSDLEHLYVDYNQLTSLPAEIGSLSNLEHLNVSHNKLTSLPAEIGRLSNLWRLDVYQNKLTSLPAELGGLSNLMSLLAFSNDLTSLPAEIGDLFNLRDLYVSYNKLTSLPAEIGDLFNLRELYVRNNKLTCLPAEISELRSLNVLVLEKNPNLTELPMNLGQISGLTHLDTTATAISDAVVASILNQCQSLRGAEAGRILSNRLETWKLTGKSEVDLSKVNALSEEKKITINEWLVRLERTREFSKAQAKLAALVCDMLKSVCENEGFRELFFAQVSTNLECCEDRAAMALNEIYTSWLVTCQADDAPLKHQLEIMTAVSKTLALRKALATLLQQRDQRESVETYLYYEQELKASLKLETAITHATFTGMGKCNWIDENRLVQTVNQAFFDELFELPIFQKLFKNKLLEEKKEIDEKLRKELEEAEKKGSYLQTANALGKRREEALKKLAKSWYDQQMCA